MCWSPSRTRWTDLQLQMAALLKRQEEMGGQFESFEEQAPPPHYSVFFGGDKKPRRSQAARGFFQAEISGAERCDHIFSLKAFVAVHHRELNTLLLPPVRGGLRHEWRESGQKYHRRNHWKIKPKPLEALNDLTVPVSRFLVMS